MAWLRLIIFYSYAKINIYKTGQTYSNVWAQSRKSFVERWFDCKMAEESAVLQSFYLIGDSF